MFLKMSVESGMISCPQNTQQWVASDNQTNYLISPRCSVKAVKESARVFVLNSLDPLCNLSTTGGKTERFVALPLSDFF